MSWPLFAQTPPAVTVNLEAAGSSPRAYVRMTNLFSDSGFVRAMRSGFPLHVEYDVTLRQRRANWFDREVTEAAWEYVVWYDPVRDRFVVEDAEQREELTTESELAERTERVYAVELEPNEAGTFYYHATVHARTLSDEDVDAIFDWLRGDDGDGVGRPNIFTRTARRLLVQMAPLPRLRREGKSAEFVRR